MKLVSSNLKKLAEFRRFGLDIEIEPGRDLREVRSDDPVLVAIHKAIEAGEGYIVEDTTLMVEGAGSGVEIRWQLDGLNDLAGSRCDWRVIMAAVVGNEVRVAEGSVLGTIRALEEAPDDAFAFDPWVCPLLAGGRSLYDLEQDGLKDRYSARRMAVAAWLRGEYSRCVPLSHIQPWDGEYQSV